MEKGTRRTEQLPAVSWSAFTGLLNRRRHNICNVTPDLVLSTGARSQLIRSTARASRFV